MQHCRLATDHNETPLREIEEFSDFYQRRLWHSSAIFH